MKTTPQNAKVSSFRSLNQPMHAITTDNGEAVRCIAVGDVEGSSPAYLTVNGQGESAWHSFSDIRIIDSNFLPLSNEATRGLQNAGAGASSSSGAGGGGSSSRRT